RLRRRCAEPWVVFGPDTRPRFAGKTLQDRLGLAIGRRHGDRRELLGFHGDSTAMAHILPSVGKWAASTTLPLPRYIWTPHGKQGSKLRTVRMMSMPLKFSGPFSSKIGVFCTASSYGPGTPLQSRGLAFQGV